MKLCSRSENLLNSVNLVNDTNEKTEIIFNCFSNLFEKHAPIKTLSNKEWITNTILELISKKKSLYGTFMQKRDKESYRLHKLFRNKINNKIEKNKREHILSKVFF